MFTEKKGGCSFPILGTRTVGLIKLWFNGEALKVAEEAGEPRFWEKTVSQKTETSLANVTGTLLKDDNQ